MTSTMRQRHDIAICSPRNNHAVLPLEVGKKGEWIQICAPSGYTEDIIQRHMANHSLPYLSIDGQSRQKWVIRRYHGDAEVLQTLACPVSKRRVHLIIDRTDPAAGILNTMQGIILP